MTEADVLAVTYLDTCNVYRPFKDTLISGETVFKKGLEGRIVYQDIACALSGKMGGKINQSKSTAETLTDYSLFVRPEIDIQSGDTVAVAKLGRQIVTTAGLADLQPSHNNVPLKLVKDVV